MKPKPAKTPRASAVKKPKVPLMTLKRFREIWEPHGFTMDVSPQLRRALLRAANGDFSSFDAIDRKLKAWDSRPARSRK